MLVTEFRKATDYLRRTRNRKRQRGEIINGKSWEVFQNNLTPRRKELITKEYINQTNNKCTLGL